MVSTDARHYKRPPAKADPAALSFRASDRCSNLSFRQVQPPYSPDLNPIEPSFSKLKTHLRKAGERSVPALQDRIGNILQTLTPQSAATTLPTPDTLQTERIPRKITPFDVGAGPDKTLLWVSRAIT
jgi:hypothetical protein